MVARLFFYLNSMRQFYLFLSCLIISILQPASLSGKTNMGTINIKVGESVQVYAEKSTYYTVSGSWSITGGSSFSITSRSQRSCTITGAKAGTSTLNWIGYSNAVYGEMYWTVNVTGTGHKDGEHFFYVAFQIIGKYLLFINCLLSIT